MTLHSATTAAGGFDSNTLFTVGLVVVFAVMIFFMFRNSRKRKADQESMQSKLVPGTEVMTTHGIYGRIVSIDDEKNEAVIETTPGVKLRLHRQTLSRVVEPTETTPADDAAPLDRDADATPENPGGKSAEQGPLL